MELALIIVGAVGVVLGIVLIIGLIVVMPKQIRKYINGK